MTSYYTDSYDRKIPKSEPEKAKDPVTLGMHLFRWAGISMGLSAALLTVMWGIYGVVEAWACWGWLGGLTLTLVAIGFVVGTIGYLVSET